MLFTLDTKMYIYGRGRFLRWPEKKRDGEKERYGKRLYISWVHHSYDPPFHGFFFFFVCLDSTSSWL